MENATKAMLIAAGVLIGMMILSLGIALFSELSSYVNSSHEQVKFNEINSFNAKYTKYFNVDLTIQDIVTVANMAHENNIFYDAEEDDPFYIKIFLNGSQIEADIQDSNSSNYISKLLEENLDSSIYRCNNIIYSNRTGMVIEMHFRKL